MEIWENKLEDRERESIIINIYLKWIMLFYFYLKIKIRTGGGSGVYIKLVGEWLLVGYLTIHFW